MEQTEKMGLGRRAAYLRRCMLALELLERHESDTSVRRRVFNTHIRGVLRCSYASFNNMLNEPNPQRQLEEIEKKIAE
jgi:hypothetical protein